MVAYSFNKRFIAPILAGTKRQTIRVVGRRRLPLNGVALQLYTGMRTKTCRLIGTATCIGIVPVTIDMPAHRVTVGAATYDGLVNMDIFARHDGFDGWPAMREFWRENHVGVSIFSGVMIRWGAFTPATWPAPASETAGGSSRLPHRPNS
jgi:hypothetical protein